MNKLKNVIFIYLIIILTTNLISSCGGNPDYYKISSINSIAQRIIGIDLNGIYITNELNTMNDTATIRYDSLRVKILLENYLALNNNYKNKIGIQSAYAWTKNIEYEKIFDIVITSNKDYNSFYTAGTNLKKIMSIGGGFTKHSIDSYLQYYNASDYEEYFSFNAPPEYDNTHKITIKFITENNNEFETIVENLLITK